MSRTRSYDRIALYNRVCLHAGLVPAKRTLGYFTKEQMKDLSLYLDRLDERLKTIDEQLTKALNGEGDEK